MAKTKNRRDQHWTKRPHSHVAYGESSGTKGLREKRSGEKDLRGKGKEHRENFSGANTRGEENSSIIVGRNPVIEALKSGREIDKILVSSKEGSMIKILAMAKEASVPVMYVDKVVLDRMAAGMSHQGVAAYVRSYHYSQLEDVFALAEKREEDPFVMILDSLEDPHNLGAIMRTAECAGAHGIIIPKRRACGLTETVGKASAGAIEYMPVVKVNNISATIEELKARGLWVGACDMDGETYYEKDLKGKLAVVIGSEGFGISKLVKEKCDFVLSIPMVGKINSLNASNAAAVLMYEVRKQRDGQ